MIHHVVHAYACMEGNPKRDRIKGHYGICDGVARGALHYLVVILDRGLAGTLE